MPSSPGFLQPGSRGGGMALGGGEGGRPWGWDRDWESGTESGEIALKGATWGTPAR